MQIAFKPNIHKGEDAIEPSLLDDVAAGTYDMTWTAQRPWPARGDKAFDALRGAHSWSTVTTWSGPSSRIRSPSR